MSTDLRSKLNSIQKKVAVNNAPVITKYVGVTDEEAIAFAEKLVDDHKFSLNINAVTKSQGLVVQVQSVTKPTCVFAYWESGKAMITGQLPAGAEAPNWATVA